MPHQSEFRPRVKAVDLALLIALGGVALTATVIFVKRLSPLARQVITGATVEESDGPPLFYSVIGRTPAEFVSTQTSAAASAQFTVEIGQAKTQEEASAAIAKLQAGGIEAFYTPLNRGGRVIYRIRNGVYADETLARDQRERLVKSGVIGTVTRL